MSEALIHDVRLVRPGESIAPASVVIAHGKIAGIVEPSHVEPDVSRVEGHGNLLTPGLIDLHTHGIGMHTYDRGPDDLLAGSAMLPRFGATCILPTLYRVMNRPSLGLLERMADALPLASGAHMPGFHLEGPFLALAGAGADTIPGDVQLLNEILAACKHRVIAMSISPEIPGATAVIERLVERKIVPFITHTCASVEETQAAIDAGARHATHFYDVFPIPRERETGVRQVGAVEAILADPRVSVDFICDGVHAPPLAVKATLAAKSWRNLALITDSNIGTALPAGEYETPWGFVARVDPDDASRIATPGHPNFGCLACSSLTMDRGIRNLTSWLNLPTHEIWAMATSNPARIVGLEKKGHIRPGADADLVLWNESLHVLKTWVGGRLVYSAEQGSA
jgi:N-acetylglucosamine-6-phosphate deacetylase